MIGINADQRGLVPLPRLALSPVAAQSIRTRTLRRQPVQRSTMRMLAIAAMVAALIVGAAVVGAQLVRRIDRDLSEVALAAHADAIARQVKALYAGTDKATFRA